MRKRPRSCSSGITRATKSSSPPGTWEGWTRKPSHAWLRNQVSISSTIWAGVPISESYQPVPASGLYDYFHINSVKLDTDGNLLVSSRHTWTVYKVNRTTGAIIWRLGGKKSDFALGRVKRR